MKLTLQRSPSSEACTLGTLDVDGQQQFYTCEDVVREMPNLPVREWKVPGETAIPAGTYQVIVNRSERFGRDMPLLLNVPGFAGVRIHSGNTAADTEGCILVGERLGNDAVVESRKAFGELFTLIEAALDAGELCHIEIRSAP